MKFDWLIVSRDLLVALVLPSVTTAVVTGAGAGTAAIIGTAALTLTASFCLIACLKAEDRFRHLLVVALGAWLLGLSLNLATGRIGEFNQAMGFSMPSTVAFSVLAVGITAAAGGLLSLLIVRKPPASAAPPS